MHDWNNVKKDKFFYRLNEFEQASVIVFKPQNMNYKLLLCLCFVVHMYCICTFSCMYISECNQSNLVQFGVKWPLILYEQAQMVCEKWKHMVLYRHCVQWYAQHSGTFKPNSFQISKSCSAEFWLNYHRGWKALFNYFHSS